MTEKKLEPRPCPKCGDKPEVINNHPQPDVMRWLVRCPVSHKFTWGATRKEAVMGWKEKDIPRDVLRKLLEADGEALARRPEWKAVTKRWPGVRPRVPVAAYRKLGGLD